MLSLAVGIGANTAIFSVVAGVLLRPLPARDPSKLVAVGEQSISEPGNVSVTSPANLFDWQRTARGNFAAWQNRAPRLTRIVCATEQFQEAIAVFSPDGSRVLIGGDDGSVRLLDVSTGQVIGKPENSADAARRRWRVERCLGCHSRQRRKEKDRGRAGRGR